MIIKKMKYINGTMISSVIILITFFIIMCIKDIKNEKILQEKTIYKISTGYGLEWNWDCISYELNKEILVMKLNTGEEVKILYPSNIRIEEIKKKE